MKTKLCVSRGVIQKDTGKIATGVFTWEGRSWRTATITGLVRELPPNISDKDLQRAYREEVRKARA